MNKNLLSAILFTLAAGLAVPAYGGAISGALSGDATGTPTGTPGIYIQNFTGAGDDSTLGQFTSSSMSTADFSHPPTITLSDGMFTESFAGGILFGVSSGSTVTTTSPTTESFTGSYTGNLSTPDGSATLALLVPCALVVFLGRRPPGPASAKQRRFHGARGSGGVSETATLTPAAGFPLTLRRPRGRPTLRGMATEQAQRHYRGDAGRDYHRIKRGVPEQALPWVTALRARKFAPLVGAQDVVLEYGVGAGWNLAGLRCGRKIGFDVSEFLEPSLRAMGIEFVADTHLLPDALADVVISHHTLEHVLHPPEALAEIRRLLRSGGRLLLYVPLEREAKYERFNPAEANHHLYSWNVQTLGNLVQETGCEVAEAGIGEFGYARFAAVWAAKLRLGETGFRCVRRLLHLLRPTFEVRIKAIKPN